jgi:transposase InsO family protein
MGSSSVVSAVRDKGSEPTRTAFGCPWQNGVAERWVGSCRRDLDHVIILNEWHLNRLLSSYLSESEVIRRSNSLRRGLASCRGRRRGVRGRFA